MHRIRRFFLPLVLTAAALIMLMQAWDARVQRERYQRLVDRTRYPVPGFYVPPVAARSIEGEPTLIGAPEAPERQLYFVLTTTCPYCEATLPVWEDIAAAARAVDSIPTTVYVISNDSLAVTRAYAAEHGLTPPVLLWEDARDAELFRARDVPLTVLVGSDRRVRYARPGQLIAGSPAVDSLLSALRMPDVRSVRTATADSVQPGG